VTRFTTAPIEDVVPKRKAKQPTQRAQTREQYQQALRNAILGRSEALVVELEDGEKALTIRNRIKAAADWLGLEHIKIRRRGNRIIAYQDPGAGE
jgi:hypothetical protein